MAVDDRGRVTTAGLGIAYVAVETVPLGPLFAVVAVAAALAVTHIIYVLCVKRSERSVASLPWIYGFGAAALTLAFDTIAFVGGLLFVDGEVLHYPYAITFGPVALMFVALGLSARIGWDIVGHPTVARTAVWTSWLSALALDIWVVAHQVH